MMGGQGGGVARAGAAGRWMMGGQGWEESLVQVRWEAASSKETLSCFLPVCPPTCSTRG